MGVFGPFQPEKPDSVSARSLGLDFVIDILRKCDISNITNACTRIAVLKMVHIYILTTCIMLFQILIDFFRNFLQEEKVLLEMNY